jgi:ribose 5-phosphate isomerase RpiB
MPLDSDPISILSSERDDGVLVEVKGQGSMREASFHPEACAALVTESFRGARPASRGCTTENAHD